MIQTRWPGFQPWSTSFDLPRNLKGEGWLGWGQVWCLNQKSILENIERYVGDGRFVIVNLEFMINLSLLRSDTQICDEVCLYLSSVPKFGYDVGHAHSTHTKQSLILRIRLFFICPLYFHQSTLVSLTYKIHGCFVALIDEVLLNSCFVLTQCFHRGVSPT